jgi:hypothetical protein
MSDSAIEPVRVVLYDGALGGTPDAQGKMRYRTSRDAAATQSFAEGRTTLDSTANQQDAAGYMADPAALPALDRAAGYAIIFDVQVVEEYHDDSDKNGDGVGDRAGFSVLVLGSDTRGIEIGFWRDKVWAQEDGAAEPPAGTLFTQAESAAFDTSSQLLRYTLTLRGDGYELSSGGSAILNGRLRDYTAFEGPVNPYRTPNFVFLGDDSGSAQGVFRLAYVALMVGSHEP